MCLSGGHALFGRVRAAMSNIFRGTYAHTYMCIQDEIIIDCKKNRASDCDYKLIAAEWQVICLSGGRRASLAGPCAYIFSGLGAGARTPVRSG